MMRTSGRLPGPSRGPRYLGCFQSATRPSRSTTALLGTTIRAWPYVSCRSISTLSGLRHAAATILLEEGVPMKVVSELLGHSSTKVTAETYSHVTARLVAEAGAAIERALG
jgi:integrase